MIDQKQMIELIDDVLTRLGDKYNSNKALELVYNTGLVESKYVYLKQIKGPACGVFQCEPFTCLDMINNYLKYRESLMKKVAEVCELDWSHFTSPDEKKMGIYINNKLSCSNRYVQTSLQTCT